MTSITEEQNGIQQKKPFYRSVPFQIAVAAGVSFTAPGMWDALGGLGAGGAAEPYAVSAANAILYALFAVFCVLAGAINNRIGLKWGLALGAGFFWAAEAAIIIGYPSPKERGFYLACWQTAKASGPIIGGAITLGLNANRETAGSVGSGTYIVFIVLMCLGLPIALCLSPAHKVWRKDGTRVVVHKHASWWAELQAVGRLAISRRIVLLVPAFFISYFYNPFVSTWLTSYFTVRSRAFSSFFTPFAGIFSSFIIGTFLDRQSIFIRTRARIAFATIVTLLVGTWIWAIILQKRFYDNPPVFDWFKGGFGSAYALVFFWTFTGQAFQQYCYWLIGQYTTDLTSLSHHTGILRGLEALGQTVAWAMQSEAGVNHFVSIGINFGILLIAIVPTWIVVSALDHTHEEVVTEEQVVGSDKADEEGSLGHGNEGLEAAALAK
ncbi:hypothetical protein I302_101579 [Kwoniella bestiolae CBS 10118]|uniref:DUF895 domain membrane protein n=1 Tax=Kwoniella bestiolae CBS 10118 TaxID=1296100 RepID=A0AAJ8K294_9TREE